MAYDPALLSQVLGLGGLDAKQTQLQRQMQTAQALRQGSGRRATTPLGAILTGVADAGGAIGGAVLEDRYAKQMAELGKQRETGRQAFLSGVEQADQTGRQQEAGALLSSRPFVPFADEYNAQSLTMRDATARAGTQQRQRDARSLALVSGDPALKAYADSLKPDNSEAALAIREQGLEQGALRLSLAKEAEARKAGALEKTLGLRERQLTAQKEAAERKAADKTAADETKKTEKGFDRETGFRKELHLLPEVKDFAGIDNAYNTLRESARDPSGSAGVTTIFSFMKMIDPGVAVMEGDVDRIRAAGGPAAKWANLYQQALSGNPLPESVRADLVKQGALVHRIRKQAYDDRVSQYRALAERAGVDPDAVAPLQSGPAATARTIPGTPTVTGGEVRIRLPDGSEKFIPPDKVEEAKRDYGAVVL